MTTQTPLLAVKELTHRFGGALALDNCSWSLQQGLIAALIGPNGAGKTTLVNVIAGALPLQQGLVEFQGRSIGGKPRHVIARHGIIRTFQLARDFQRLTVLENMLLAVQHQPGESLWNALFRPRLGRTADRHALTRAAELLNAFDLYRLKNDYASDLSGGQQRLLELARAMMADPKILILDEPMSGINPMLVERICQHLQDMRAGGMTILLVEHNLAVVELISDRVSVMANGQVLAHGLMSDLRNDPAVVAAYLGGDQIPNAAN